MLLNSAANPFDLKNLKKKKKKSHMKYLWYNK